ncbi:autotransporter assembly complex protein TamA [Candidatus Similichlamydia laticola]|uniref:autotransporter assembly complex protein TamA n=1 Tax=Candidatus Similichlamydia laticola TaxID=2170265 RepID=UPI0011C036D4|nr:BamA/TamA family outer membrane protein [Candidatus Similichlamydia laticola]
MSSSLNINYDPKTHALHITVIQGPLYSVHSFSILENDSQELSTIPPNFSFPFPARTNLIHLCLDQIKDSYLNSGFPFADLSLKKFDLIPNKNQVDLIVNVVPGTKFFFGETSFLQQNRCSNKFLREHLTFKRNEVYSAKRVAETLKNLEKTGLFEEVRSEFGPPDHLTHSLPIIFRVPEASPRSAGLGFSISTHNGLGAVLDWSHENLWGAHEQVHFYTMLNQSEQELHISYLNPFRKAQDLSLAAAISAKRRLCYDALEHSGALSLDLLLGPRSLQKIGIKIEKFYDTLVGESFLFSVPFEGSHPYFDRTGQSLSTIRFWWTGEPILSFAAKQVYFLKLQGGLALRLPLLKDGYVAFHTQAHSIMGTERDQVPLALRCFGGSSHILRGYAYRSVSPLSTEGMPIGGMSLLAFSIEPRIPLSKDLDFVSFLDMGQTYPQSCPNRNNSFLYSVGVGLRKRTPLGFIRADVGFPLNRRAHLDNPMELYILFGENF